MGSLVQTREELERRVDDLRAFEHEYRNRLKAYVEEHGTDDTLQIPQVTDALTHRRAGT
jgi:hypothetical protein